MDGSQPPWDPFSHLWIVFKNVFLNRKISIIWTNSIISSSFAICHIIDTCNSIDVKCKLSNGHSVNVYGKKKSQRKKKIGCGVCLTSGQWTRNKVLSITQPCASHLYSMSHQKCQQVFSFFILLWNTRQPTFCLFPLTDMTFFSLSWIIPYFELTILTPYIIIKATQ